MAVSGAAEHEKRLRRMRGAIIQPVTQALFVGAQAIALDAQISISAGATSGAGHVVSAPGQPPNNDTGALAGNIEANSFGPLTAEASSNAPYAAALEFGTSRMAARPYMQPAALKSRPDIVRNVEAAVNRVIRGG